MKKLSILLPTLLVAGCVNLAPKNQTPEMDKVALSQYEEIISKQYQGINVNSWEDYIVGNQLREVIIKALDNNKDIEIAEINIEKAIEAFRISKTDNLPKIDLGVGASKGKVQTTTESLSADIGFSSYELDFFGKVKNQNKAALKEYESIIEDSRVVKKTVINKTLLILNSIASNNEMLDKLNDIYINAQEAENIIEKKVKFGLSKESDLSNAKLITLRAKYDLEATRTELYKNKTALNIIVGEVINDHNLPRNLSDMRNQFSMSGVDIDSELMLMRPDILMVEKKLEAADANIGVARASFYPSIKLTSNVGLISNDLSNLTTSGTWSLAPSINLPIFNSGLNKSKLKISKLERKRLVSEYQKTVNNAFKEVADNLYEKESLISQLKIFSELLIESNKSYDLAESAYKEGIADFLDILTLKRELYKTEKEFITLKGREFENMINLYHSVSAYE